VPILNRAVFANLKQITKENRERKIQGGFLFLHPWEDLTGFLFLHPWEDLTGLFSFLYIAAKLQELYGSLSSTRSL
jgi:hypothetical protein